MNISKTQILLSVLVVIALFACTLPWVSNPSAALSLSVYDLAEWTSLVPAVRGGSPPLLPTLLLRLPLACLAWIIASQSGNRLARGIVVVIAAIALLPPLQFINTPDDINYRQQFVLAVITLIIGLIGVSDRLRQWHSIVALGVAIAGVLIALVGMAQGYTLMRDFQLPTQIGLGGIVFALCLAVIGLQQTRQLTARKLPRQTV